MTAVELYPAIDLRGGRVVRLTQGDYDREVAYGDDPVAVAESFAAAGATWIHVVDLDAARTGSPENRSVVAAIAPTTVRFSGDPLRAASRSTTWIHRAPAAAKDSATATGSSPYDVSRS